MGTFRRAGRRLRRRGKKPQCNAPLPQSVSRPTADLCSSTRELTRVAFLWKGTNSWGCVWLFPPECLSSNIQGSILFTFVVQTPARPGALRAEGGLDKCWAHEAASAKWFFLFTYILYCGPMWTHVLSWNKYSWQSWCFNSCCHNMGSPQRKSC